MNLPVFQILSDSVEVASSVLHEQISERFGAQIVEISDPKVAQQRRARFVFVPVPLRVRWNVRFARWTAGCCEEHRCRDVHRRLEQR